MAITGNIVHKGIQINGAYARIQRIFGGKHEAGEYGALVQLFPAKSLAGPDNVLAEYRVEVTYAQGDPYPMLYTALKQLRYLTGVDQDHQPVYGALVFDGWTDDLE